MLADRVRMGVVRGRIYTANDSDFSGTRDGTFKYIGTNTEVRIPHIIKGVSVTSYYEMFRDTSVTKVVSDNPNVTYMSSMFNGSKATSLDLSSFDTSNAKYMNNMFSNSKATSLDLSSFDTSNVTDMYGMFANSQATSLDLSSFDTSKVTDMSYMFYESEATTGYARTYADADRFNATRNKPSGLNFIVRGGIYTAKDSDFSGTTNGTFKYIGTNVEVRIPHIIKGVAVTSYANMFEYTSVTKVVSDNPNVTNMGGMFYASKATSLDLSSFDTSKVTDMKYMFSNSKATSLDLSSFDTSNVTTMTDMFSNSQATSIDLSSFNTSNVTDMVGMFANSKAAPLDLSSFDTSKVTDMGYMFAYSVTTTGYARTYADADRFNASSGKPSGLKFVVR